jgi:hypothetical protein
MSHLEISLNNAVLAPVTSLFPVAPKSRCRNDDTGNDRMGFDPNG